MLCSDDDEETQGHRLGLRLQPLRALLDRCAGEGTGAVSPLRHEDMEPRSATLSTEGEGERMTADDQSAKKYAPPAATTQDLAAAVGKAALQAIPLGGSALELIGLAIGPPLERRRNEWMGEVADGLRGAEVAIEQLAQRVDLLDTFIEASRAALGTASSEKRRALRNAVVNTAIGLEPGEALRRMLLQLVERLTPLHLQTLRVLADLQGYANRLGFAGPRAPDVKAILVAALPALSDDEYVFDLVWRDLAGAQLIDGRAERGPTGWPYTDIKAQRASALGRRLLAFIDEPERLARMNASEPS